jgi:hypothetical protein
MLLAPECLWEMQAPTVCIAWLQVEKPHAVEQARMVKEQVDKRDRHLISAYVVSAQRL